MSNIKASADIEVYDYDIILTMKVIPSEVRLNLYDVTDEVANEMIADLRDCKAFTSVRARKIVKLEV